MPKGLPRSLTAARKAGTTLPSDAAAVAAISTANGSDAGTTQTLANATKTKVNELITELKKAGVIK